MSLVMLGIGTAVPDQRISQADAAGLAVTFANAVPGRERALAAVYRQSGIASRGSVLLEPPAEAAYSQRFFPPATTGDRGPSTAVRMARYAREAGPLAARASAAALADSGLDAAAVTHLVTCSCTGFANPGVDLELMRDLGIAATVARTHVGFMGCHGAFNALRVADAFAAADPAAVVLVACIELCSLHFQYGSRGDHIVANSLFADGAAAVVGVPARRVAATVAGWRIVGQASQVLADSDREMGWLIGDTGFEMTLSPRVPDLVAGHLRAAVDRAIAASGYTFGDVATWAVHPGGPRVLAATAETLGLDRDALAASWDVLAGHGNMSSATILFILDRMLRPEPPAAAGPCVALAFGPGLTVEMALFGR
jgi:predicted naringenin-chalcone synthase